MDNFDVFIEKMVVKIWIVMIALAGLGGMFAFVVCRSFHNGIIGAVALGVAYMMYYNYKKEYPAK